MKKGFKAVTAIFTMLLTGGLLGACHHHFRGHITLEKIAEKIQKHIDGGLKKVGTTEEQNEKIHRITGRIIDDAVQTHKTCAGNREAIAANLLSDSPDRDELHKQVDEKAKTATEFIHRAVDRLIEISAVLTHEQRIELSKRFENNHAAQGQ